MQKKAILCWIYIAERGKLHGKRINERRVRSRSRYKEERIKDVLLCQVEARHKQTTLGLRVIEDKTALLLILSYYFSACSGASIVIGVSVCLFVCLRVFFVCLLVCPLKHLNKLHVHISPNFLYPICYLRPWLSPPQTTMQYVMYVLFGEWCHVFT